MIIDVWHGEKQLTSYICDMVPRKGEMVCCQGQNWRVVDVVWVISGMKDPRIGVVVVPEADHDDPLEPMG